MKILVCCADGMSSSLLVQKMREEVKSRNLEDVKIGSCAKIQLNRYLNEADIVLIAPQLHFFAQEIKNISQPYHVQVIDIDMQDYGNLNAKAILDKVLEPPVSSATSYNKESKLTQLMNKLYPYTKNIATNRPLNAINKAFISIMPATVIGSLFILIKNLPFNNYTAWLEKSGLSDILNLASGATIDILSIYLAFFISYHLVESYQHQGHGAGLISTVCFFLVTGRTNNGYDITYLGSNGMFSAIFISITVGYLYIKIINRHMQIQLPKNVPAQVHRSFEAIIPSFIIIFIFLVITALIAKTPYGNLNTMVYTFIQSTLMKIMGNNIFSFIFFNLIACLLWWFGIHGGNVVGFITTPVYTSLSLQNQMAYQAGQTPPNIISGAFNKCFTSGGVGSMLSLSILMIIFSKSKKYKLLGRISLPTCIFYINEPLLFGVPIVMNPLFFIPLTLTTPTLSVLTYFVMKIGLIPIPNGAQVPWTTPPVIYGFLQGSWKIALWEVISIILAMLMWYPFFTIADRQAYKEENNSCHN